MLLRFRVKIDRIALTKGLVAVACTEGTGFVRAKGEISRTHARARGEQKSQTNQKTTQAVVARG